ncbi:U6 snRNA-associated Sm-like protein LSm8 [Galemys pyrenaicus]|uniref:U6 snRNA-associated Sm-like protein LSm8 n=1 Tax=Galemys pyrenaicus TaxID=202257 RepID=A0A8J6AVQ7_GALPY|nr:U6 snRNA-associated Sm-like protein LSm8 [Galemys pyrenaicus]
MREILSRYFVPSVGGSRFRFMEGLSSFFRRGCRCVVRSCRTEYHDFRPGELYQPYPLGTLKGFDQTINLILDESHERVFSSSQGVEQVVLGLYIVRGDNVAVIGEIDEETDSALDLGNIRAEPLNSVAH